MPDVDAQIHELRLSLLELCAFAGNHLLAPEESGEDTIYLLEKQLIPIMERLLLMDDAKGSEDILNSLSDPDAAWGLEDLLERLGPV